MTSSPPHSPVSAEAKLKALYSRHFDFVWRSLARFGVESASLEDLTHEAFIVYFKKYMDYQGPAAPSTLLYGIARRVAANHRRSVARREQREQAGWAVARPTGSDPESAVAQKDAQDLVLRFLDSLSAENAEIFRLTQIEGLLAKDVAQIFEMNLNTLNSRIRSAKRKFEAFVQELQGADQEVQKGDANVEATRQRA